MKKFNEAYKEKMSQAEELHESQVLADFKVTYNALLEQYNLTSIEDLDEDSQVSFLTELNNYWSEEEGMSEKGQKFVETRSLTLNENSTTAQKKQYLKTKVSVMVNETMRNADLRWKIYEVIDEAYNQLEAEDLRDILAPKIISEIVNEALTESMTRLSNTITKELNESAKPEPKKYVVKKTI
jgi:hypothetical protein